MNEIHNGGNIKPNQFLKNILSIGFEFETDDDCYPLIYEGGVYKQFRSVDGEISKEETLNYFFKKSKDGIFKQLPLADINQLRAEAYIEFTLSQDIVESRYAFLEEDKKFTIEEIMSKKPKKQSKIYNCIQDEITHLEFVITFYKIDVSNDIINEKYKESKKMITQFIDGYCEKIDNQRYLPYVRMPPNKEFMIISNGKEIKYKPQCTIKIKYINVLPMIIYLLIDHKTIDYEMTYNILYDIITETDRFYGYIKNSIKEDSIKKEDIVNIENIVKIKTWLFLVIYYWNCYSRHKEKDEDHPKNLLKYHFGVILRHPLEDIFPFNENIAEIIKDVLLEKKLIIINPGDISLFEYFDILLGKIIKKEQVGLKEKKIMVFEVLTPLGGEHSTLKGEVPPPLGGEHSTLKGEKKEIDSEVNMFDYRDEEIYMEYRLFRHNNGIREKNIDSEFDYDILQNFEKFHEEFHKTGDIDYSDLLHKKQEPSVSASASPQKKKLDKSVSASPQKKKLDKSALSPIQIQNQYEFKTPLKKTSSGQLENINMFEEPIKIIPILKSEPSVKRSNIISLLKHVLNEYSDLASLSSFLYKDSKEFNEDVGIINEKKLIKPIPSRFDLSQSIITRHDLHKVAQKYLETIREHVNSDIFDYIDFDKYRTLDRNDIFMVIKIVYNLLLKNQDIKKPVKVSKTKQHFEESTAATAAATPNPGGYYPIYFFHHCY